jgi:colanic acid/amylovoran biosynthesis glycosyltransferase
MNMQKHFNDRKPVVAHSLYCWLPLTMTWVYNQLKYATEYNSIVLTERAENLKHFPWNPVYISKKQLFPNFLRFFRGSGLLPYPTIIAEAVAAHDVEILHSHFGDRGWYDMPLAKKHRFKHVVTFYGYDLSMFPVHLWKSRYKALFDKSDLFLCEGPYMAQRLVNLGCPHDKVKVQRLGVEIDEISFVPREIKAEGFIKILIAGRFQEKKGIPYALEAIGKLKNTFPNMRATVIGDSTGQEREEREKKRIMNVISQYNLKSMVNLVGFKQHATLLQEAYNHHIFLSPSVTSSDGDTEGGAPVTIIEMAASGMPIISTKHCDIPEVIIDGKTGILCRERNVDDLCDALSSLINNNDIIDSFGRLSRQHVREKFDVRRQAVQLAKHYKELLE